VVELLERAKALEAAGARVVHFEVGEPDFATAPAIVAAGQAALVAGHTRYTQSLGTPALRERIAAFYEAAADVRVDPARVVVTAGASGALLLLGALLLDPEQELLITEPGYPCNKVFAGLVNACSRALPVTAADGFLLQPAVLAASLGPASRALLLGSPANSTGVTTPPDRLRALLEVLRPHGTTLILDEIYQGLRYGPGPTLSTGLGLGDDLAVVNSFSKYFGMTGWRLGWMVVPEDWLDGVARLAQNLFISPSAPAQQAALAAFEPAAMAVHEERRQRFAARRDRLLEGLRQLGLDVPVTPDGAFYLYADVSATGLPAEVFCRRLLDEHQVAVTPGMDFGERDADRFVRFAYTTGEDDIELGLERIAAALQAWR